MLTKTPQDQYIKIGSINTRYWALGDQDSIVVLLHGGGGCIDYWVPNIYALAQHHRVYALDMVGHGRTDKPPASYSIDYMTQFVKDFIDTLGIERANLVGISGGGCVALKFALSFPDMLEKLVLISSVGLGKEIAIGLRLATLPLVGELLTRPSRATSALLIKQAAYDQSLATDELIEMIYQMSILPGVQRTLLQIARTSFNLFGLRPELINPILNQLKTITAPTLIIWGQQDRFVPVAHAHFAAKTIPNARLDIFENCGHWAPLEYPEKFNTLVCEFLATAVCS